MSVAAAEALRNALTIDVEDYFQVSAFDAHIARAQWPAQPCRIERNVERILALLETHQARATFFTLGWIAERYPALVRRIVDGGHELASHGYAHLRASDQTPAEFADDIRRSKHLLEQLGGQAVKGYRAPSFSIAAGNLWALDSLQAAGYRYSSSIYPIRHDHYGMPDAPRFASRPTGAGGLLELPISTVRVLGRNMPAGGGGYFRLLPYATSRWALRRINSHDGQAGIFYFHPWELDPGQPRPAGIGVKTRFRHYLNLHRMEHRIGRLLGDFRWGRIDDIFLGTA
ncbi:polysaccharide deacetylase family protein, PEP-CTERM locus subfamily [Duganella sp. CF517]|uniref:XrtA system polysaccharide deacetylase n=1 Tax=Duganella sp. CF517 TaxID=1881038 RepID=UPI0008D23C58|nr:XrtA system polysaccharide deacetylase [Duganella sp. CF517]SEN80793.1 polysaccharide deacetylase family protein, PEP-CTERM locus subfamily [Duganella sp. CF517]